ncbi:peptidylprolyl isomerase [Caldivirga sp. UBA161]|uniref:peptidylprolyl isomerase n=1 Tax=Caldivirga sp. UBA161 TaxID=1915569 RepID=UPI0025BD99FA|nr:peptidylprolyl isomerase [Caldivirga sp. UBA161]
MVLQKGDYILLDYTMLTKDDGKVIETTIEEKAKEANIYDPNQAYGPRLIILGETKIFEPLEEALLKSDEGSEVTVEVPPEKAFGLRDQGKVKVISIREFYRTGKVPRVGDIVEYNNQRARVISVSSGRVILDFNHPLAGKVIVVNAKVVKKLTNDEDKVKEIVRQYLPRLDMSRVETKHENGQVTVKLPSEVLFIEGIGTIKFRIAEELAQRFTDVKKIIYVEELEVTREEQQAQQLQQATQGAQQPQQPQATEAQPQQAQGGSSE